MASGNAVRSLFIRGGVLRFDDGEIGVMLRGATGEVAADIQRRAYAVQKRMKRSAPERTGALRAGIRAESARPGLYGPASRVVSSAPHTNLVEEGRGWVHPRRASRLRFEGKRAGEIVYAKRSRPQEGSHFMRDSLDAALD